MTVSGTPRAYMSSPNQGPAATDGRLVVIHTAEGATSAAGLGGYFGTTAAASSSHVGIDADGVIQYVPYARQSWTLRNGNPISENAELCGFASMSRAEWLSERDVTREFIPGKGRKTVRRPRQMLRHAAAWTARRCAENKVPLRKIGPADVDAGQRGVIGHADWTLSRVGQGTHTDPGPGFPWDVFMEDVQRFANTNTLEDDMTVDELLNATVVREGLPEGHPLAGQEVRIGTILSWSDANLGAIGDAVAKVEKKVQELVDRPAAEVKVDATEVAAAVLAVTPDIVKAVADEVANRMAA